MSLKKLWLLCALVLSLLPNGAAAEMRAHEPEHRHESEQLLRSAGSYAEEAIRSNGGLESLRALESDRLRETTSRVRVDGSSPAHAPSVTVHWPRLAVACSTPETETAIPLCERLPYDSTAPPSRR